LALLALGCTGAPGAKPEPSAVDAASHPGQALDGGEVPDGPLANASCPAATWHALAVPAAEASDSFATVAAAGPNDAWMCSVTGGPPAVVAAHLLHWDGQAFAETPVADGGEHGPTSCGSLWASAPGELWAGGLAHQVDHLVNGVWTPVNLLDQRPASAMWGTSPSNVWIVGLGSYWSHWDGTRLSDRPPGGAPGTSVWGTGEDDLWTVYGDVWHVSGAGANDDYTLASIAPASTVTLSGIWASDDTHVWVVGSAGFIGFFDGGTWAQGTSGTAQDLTGVWGSSATDVWAVGNAGTIVHWDGSAWSGAPAPVSTNLHAIFGADACDVWAVGESGAVLALEK
jgi:hypothetical protein